MVQKRTTNPVKPKITYSLSDNKYYLRHKLYGRDEREQSLRFNITGINSQNGTTSSSTITTNDIDLFINGVFENV
jgi:hypothetical protein